MIIQLTRENYHSLEANRAFMSNSQYKAFLECEAKQMAILAGTHIEETSDAFLVGSYVHAWAEGRKDEFIAEHPEMFLKGKKELKAPFKSADDMIYTLVTDQLCLYMLEGRKEVILTAEFAGTPWKIMIDAYQQDRRRIVDLKTTRNIREKVWDNEVREKVSFVEQYKYIQQAAIYTEIERLASGREDIFDFYIVAVSKQDPPDKEVIDLRDPERYYYELEQVKANMPRILAVKSGQETPNRCERCDFCRKTRKLTGAIHYTEL